MGYIDNYSKNDDNNDDANEKKNTNTTISSSITSSTSTSMIGQKVKVTVNGNNRRILIRMSYQQDMLLIWQCQNVGMMIVIMPCHQQKGISFFRWTHIC